jgi:serine/threonine protein kinase
MANSEGVAASGDRRKGEVVTPERWKQIERVFEEAIDLPSGARPAFLERTCQGDEEMRREVESLLGAHEEASSLLDHQSRFLPQSLGHEERFSLTTGQMLGRYRILSLIGHGGMGEVYRARDPELGRDVAIKVLPTAFSADLDRLARFEQEAYATGALNHPNIVSVYDIGASGGNPYIVSELLEGETLREKLRCAQLSQRKGIDYALQIAQGLAAAHEHGILHRDLKPENVFITNDERAKILDFGLAKLMQLGIGDAQSPMPRIDTHPGAVMGTVGYTAPEQVRGQKVDHRADIFSFGCILYEILSGRKAFGGGSPVDTLGAILKEDPPDLSESNRNVSPALERLVLHCLEKNPAARFNSARDLAFALEALGSSNISASQPTTLAPIRTRWRVSWPWLVAGLAGMGVILAFVLSYFRPIPDRSATVVHFQIMMPAGSDAVLNVEAHNTGISPDGRYFAFVGFSDGQSKLWIRPLASLKAQALPGTERAHSIFWSPDSHYLAFFADGKLKRVEISGKSLQTVCGLTAAGSAAGTWGSQGTIVFSEELDGSIYRVAATGGRQSLLLKGKGAARRWLNFLPDGEHFIFYKLDEGENNAGIFAGSLGSSQITQIAAMPPARAQFVKGGYLLYPREGSLVVQALDEKTLRLTGEPTVVIELLPYFAQTGWAEFSASETGAIAYLTEFPKSRLVWLDRSGREIGQVGDTGDYSQVRIAPNGQVAALTSTDPRVGSGEVWIQDLARGTRVRFASGPMDDQRPVWSPDGRRLAYFSCCGDASTLRVKSMGESGPGIMPIPDERFITPYDWSPDGQFIIYWKGDDLWVLPVAEVAKRYALMKTEFSESGARLSPDGQWVAFVSDETGQREIYVTRFDHPGEKWRLSSGGGVDPCWKRDGRELFYVSADNRLMAVGVRQGATLDMAKPAALFKVDPLASGYDVATDGQRFLFITSAQGTQPPPFTVVLNWIADLKP